MAVKAVHSGIEIFLCFLIIAFTIEPSSFSWINNLQNFVDSDTCIESFPITVTLANKDAGKNQESGCYYFKVILSLSDRACWVRILVSFNHFFHWYWSRYSSAIEIKVRIELWVMAKATLQSFAVRNLRDF